MKILILEDEKLTARDLAHTIKEIEPDAEILPFLHSVDDARFFFAQAPLLDVIFSDIDLGDGTCFEVFQAIEIPAPIIFCTAYEAYVLQALQHFGIDYILKPFQKAQVEKALLKYKVLQAKFTQKNVAYQDLLIELQKKSQSTSTSILIQQADKIFSLSQAEIAFFYTTEQLVYAQTFSDKKYILTENLEQLEQKFDTFFRVNRQYLINRSAIKEASHYFNRKLLLHLTCSHPEPIIVSRLKVNDFLTWLAQSV